MLVVPLTAVAPTTITVRFVSPVFGPDLSLVSAVSASVLRRDGTTVTFTFTIVSATTRELIAQHTFATGELTTSGAYYLAPVLSVNGGAVASETIPLFVAGPYNMTPALEQDAWIMATVPVPSLGPIKAAWESRAASFAASPYSPNIALDLRTNAITATLWSAVDGDVVTLSDVYAAAGSFPLTLTAVAGSKVPAGGGTYTTSAAFSTPGFVLRLRHRASDGLWIPA